MYNVYINDIIWLNYHRFSEKNVSLGTYNYNNCKKENTALYYNKNLLSCVYYLVKQDHELLYKPPLLHTH